MNVQVYLAMLVGCSVYALVRGGAPERWGVAILWAAILGSHFAPASGPIRFQYLEYGVLAADAAMLVAVLVIALRSQRFWPMWMAAVLINTVLTHLLMFTPKLMPWSYSVMVALWSYPNPLILAIGAWRHRTRLKRYGADPAWS